MDYTEDGDSILDLRRLKEDSDGHMDHIHDRRDAYAADLVHILVGKSDVAGRASFAGAFGLTLSRSDGQTFAHELGHNMGPAPRQVRSRNSQNRVALWLREPASA